MGEPRTVPAGDLLLRPFGDDDIGRLLEAFADPDIARWNPGPGDSPEAAAAWAERRNDWTGGGHASWAVGDRDGSLLGSVSLFSIDADQGDAEIGYWVAPWARGRRVAARALAAASGTGFDALGLHRVHLLHAVENVASCRVALRCGFAQEGLLRQSYRYADGDHHDEHLHARLRTDR